MEQHEKNEDIPKRLQLMKKRLKQVLVLFGILIITLALSGCENFVESDVSVETRLQTSYNKSEDTNPRSSKKSKSDVLLPDGWTMDDLRNLLVINEKTLTLPTTLNKIMELDDKFSYEAEYIDEKNQLYNGKQKGFLVDIFYDNVFMSTAVFESDKNDIQTILDKNIYYLSFSKTNCQKSNLNADLSCNLKFGSSFDEITSIFGEPNLYNIDNTNKEYEFYDENYQCKLSFEINSSNKNVLSFFSIRVSPLMEVNKNE